MRPSLDLETNKSISRVEAERLFLMLDCLKGGPEAEYGCIVKAFEQTIDRLLEEKHDRDAALAELIQHDTVQQWGSGNSVLEGACRPFKVAFLQYALKDRDLLVATYVSYVRAYGEPQNLVQALTEVESVLQCAPSGSNGKMTSERLVQAAKAITVALTSGEPVEFDSRLVAVFAGPLVDMLARDARLDGQARRHFQTNPPAAAWNPIGIPGAAVTY